MSERSVLITGVSSGLGLALAHQYLDCGWTVYGCSRRSPPSPPGSHSRFHFVPVDLVDNQQVVVQLDELLEGVAGLDLAVLNAGQLGSVGEITGADLGELKNLMDVNVWGVKRVLDALFTRGMAVGQVVTISSGAAVKANRGWGGYAISKAALNMLTRLYAAEHSKTHFAAVAPGLIDTAMQQYLCTLPPDPRYPSLDVLRSKRQTPDMPTPEQAAVQLKEFFAELPLRVTSGDFVDYRDYRAA